MDCPRLSAAADRHPEALGGPFRFCHGLLAAQGKAPARSCGRDGHPLRVGAAADRKGLNGFLARCRATTNMPSQMKSARRDPPFSTIDQEDEAILNLVVSAAISTV